MTKGVDWTSPDAWTIVEDVEKSGLDSDLIRFISSCDEYGGEWGGFFIAIVRPNEVLTREQWTGISRAYERYCAGELGDQIVHWEWDYVAHGEVGEFQVCQMNSNDRGGRCVWVMHPQ